RKILSSFHLRGYQEVIPPIFEYLDVFSRGSGEDGIPGMYKIIDRATGRIMVLRPDVTPQIARIGATLLADHPRPLRLCYSANVFRHEEEHAGRERELSQIGGELIGPTDAESDAEVIMLAIETLQGLGLGSFRITLGQMAFTRGLLSPFESSPDLLGQILQSVAKKEASRLDSLLKDAAVAQNLRHQVLSLLDLFGGEDVFQQTASIFKDQPLCLPGLKRLKEVYNILKSFGYQEYILIDFGEVRGFDYYTGMIFEIFAEGIGSELGGGGRYDHLLERFGDASASTGFALYLERIQAALEHTLAGKTDEIFIDFLLIYLPTTEKRANAVARRLRALGCRVICKNGLKKEFLDPDLPDAKKQKIRKILLIQGPETESSLQVIDVSSGMRRVQNQKDPVEWLRQGGLI
ncbi:MAG: ATP phosphoribosyltransferase regulatory subunit, partial [Nitrospiria bacterium]